MTNKNSEAIQKDVGDFLKKLESSAPPTKGQKLAKGAKGAPLTAGKPVPTLKAVKAAMAKKEAKSVNEPYPSITDIDFKDITAYLTKYHQSGQTPSLSDVANMFKVQHDEALELLWAGIEQGEGGAAITKAKGSTCEICGAWFYDQAMLGKHMEESHGVVGAKYQTGEYAPFLSKVAEMVSLLVETAEYEVPNEDVLLCKKADGMYGAMLTTLPVSKSSMVKQLEQQQPVKGKMVIKPLPQPVQHVSVNLSADEPLVGLTKDLMHILVNMGATQMKGKKLEVLESNVDALTEIAVQQKQVLENMNKAIGKMEDSFVKALQVILDKLELKKKAKAKKGKKK